MATLASLKIQNCNRVTIVTVASQLQWWKENEPCFTTVRIFWHLAVVGALMSVTE